MVGHHLAANGDAGPHRERCNRDRVLAAPPGSGPIAPAGLATVKSYRSDDSIFIDDEYLIKGVAGRLFHRMLQLYLDEGRDEFTNKELRVDASLRLPDYQDNLEARLVLLRKRLEERCAFLGLSRTARGRLRLVVGRHVRLTVSRNCRRRSPVQRVVSSRRCGYLRVWLPTSRLVQSPAWMKLAQ